MGNYPYLVKNGIHEKVPRFYAVENGIHRVLKKMYMVKNGVTQLFFSAGGVTFDGASELLQYTIDGTVYNVLRIKDTGTLEISGDDPVPVVLVAGGSGGCTPSSSLYAPIGGSGGFLLNGKLPPGDYTVTIGAGGSPNANGGNTVVTDANGTEVLKANGGNFNGKGASGGGGARDARNSKSVSPLPGSGDSTVPLGIADLQPHSAGGGAGASKRITSSQFIGYNGGNGGTNGSNGGNTTSGDYNRPTGGTGGEKGGGNGGDFSGTNSTGVAGTNASFYGSAGSGGFYVYNNEASTESSCSGGYGYAGCMYLIWNEDGIPFDWTETIQITKQPENVSCNVNDSVTLQVDAENATGYRWQYSNDGGATWAGLFWEGAYTSVITFNMTEVRARNLYRCQVSNDAGTVYTDVISVTV